MSFLKLTLLITATYVIPSTLQAQIPIVVNIYSWSGNTDVTFHYSVSRQTGSPGFVPVVEGSVAIELCPQGDVHSCSNLLRGGSLDSNGHGSCRWHNNMPTGTCLLYALYSDPGFENYSSSEYRRSVARNAGGGFTLNHVPFLFLRDRDEAVSA
jgi:hypothetical protein